MDLIIEQNDAGQRFDRFLRKAFKATPISLIQKAIRTGKIKINGKKASLSYVLQMGDKIESRNIEFKTVVPMEKKIADWEKNLTPMILFEDKDYLILNKPSGLPVHPGAYHEEQTLIDLLKSYLANDRSLSFEPALAHRLDKAASGVIVSAKSARALRLLAEHFRKGSLTKKYAVIVKGMPKPPEGCIKKPLIDKDGKPQEAETLYKTLQSCSDYSLLEVIIKTGRFHQIRRHMAGMGHPVLGDKTYQGPSASRLMLHSKSLQFFDWATGKTIRAEAKLPEEFVRLKNKMLAEGLI